MSHVLLQFRWAIGVIKKAVKWGPVGCKEKNHVLRSWKDGGCIVCLPLCHPPVFSFCWGADVARTMLTPVWPSAKQHFEEFRMINGEKKTQTFTSSLYFYPYLCPSPRHCVNNNSWRVKLNGRLLSIWNVAELFITLPKGLKKSLNNSLKGLTNWSVSLHSLVPWPHLRKGKEFSVRFLLTVSSMPCLQAELTWL